MEFDERFTLYNVDFSDLKQVAADNKENLQRSFIQFIVNNAGILSPPGILKQLMGLSTLFR